MVKKFNSENLGVVVYEEDFRSKKKGVFINGKPCEIIDKKTFLYKKDDGGQVYLRLKGGMLSGIKLIADNEQMVIAPPIKWYEYILSILPFIFILVWGNSPMLVDIFPIVGGVLGCLIGVIGLAGSLLVMKRAKKPLFKLLIGLGFFVAIVDTCALIALAIIL